MYHIEIVLGHAQQGNSWWMIDVFAVQMHGEDVSISDSSDIISER